jgi:hypothetical protein
LTGAPAAFEISTACTMKSTSMRRPKPPPRNVVRTVICSGLRPVTCAATPAAICWNWVGPQTRQESLRTSAVKFIGSMGAWARKGSS